MVSRVPLVVLIITFWSLKTFGQSCNCPPAISCGACSGGYTSLTLRYNGMLAGNVIAKDGSVVVYSKLAVASGGIFTFTGSKNNDTFAGANITITVNALPNASIGSNCASGVMVGDTYGSFTVMAASSKNGGSICCAPALIDATLPVISNCPVSISKNLGTGCTVPVTWTAPAAMDNCAIQSFVSTKVSGSSFEFGITIVTYTATDTYGNVAICSFNVTVVDNMPPTFTSCPANINLSAAANCKALATWTLPTAADNCSVSVSESHTSGIEFPLGTTTVMYTATDDSGLTATCTFNIVVTDTAPPSFTNCPTSINLSATNNCKAIATWTAPIAIDQCSVSVSSTHTSGAQFSLGTTIVTYTATDSSGLTATCSFNVFVKDVTPPSFSGCPSNINLSAVANCKAVATWTAPAAADNCSISLSGTHTSGSAFPLGTTTVTYTVTDGAGLTATCSFNVIVKDNTPPTFTTCPTNITISASANCKAIATWVTPIAVDNCSVNVSATHTSGAGFSLGTTIVTYTATDGTGNKSTCSFNIIVTDTTPPSFSNCPTSINLSVANNCKAIATWTAPIAADQCSAATIVGSSTSGREFDPGTTTVTYTATDSYGNKSTCSFDVIVATPQGLQVSNCPQDIVIAADESTALVTWTDPTFTLPCATLTISKSHSPDSRFNIGNTTVIYTASDGLGNSIECSFNVTVTEPSLDLEISKLITPDGDGFNDAWVITNLDKYPDNSVIVFDRWGSVIFHVYGYNNEDKVWRGENKSGATVPTGTYFFAIEVSYSKHKEKREGFIEVVQ